MCGSNPDLLASWSVSVPLEDLNALIAAARELPALQHELSRCYEQLDACRRMHTELMNKYLELYKLL